MPGPVYAYLHERQWVMEGSDWQPSTSPPTPDVIVIRDSAGVAVGFSSISTLVLTLYDPTLPTHPIINAIEQANIKNDGVRGVISPLGVLTLKLIPADLVTTAAHASAIYERRDALVEWTATNNRAGALLFQFCIRNLSRRPYVP